MWKVIPIFYDRWMEKANKYSDNDISDVFDKFFTLYVIYNILYNVIPQGVKNGDRNKATCNVLDFVIASNKIEILNTNNENFIKILITLIDSGEISVKLVQSSSKRKLLDEGISSLLKSDEPEKKTKAILEIIYNIRCNLFHGDKEFKQYELKILKPLNEILKHVIEVLYQILKEKQIICY